MGNKQSTTNLGQVQTQEESILELSSLGPPAHNGKELGLKESVEHCNAKLEKVENERQMIKDGVINKMDDYKVTLEDKEARLEKNKEAQGKIGNYRKIVGYGLIALIAFEATSLALRSIQWFLKRRKAKKSHKEEEKALKEVRGKLQDPNRIVRRSHARQWEVWNTFE